MSARLVKTISMTSLFALLALLILAGCSEAEKPNAATPTEPTVPVITDPNSWILGVDPAKSLALIEDHSDALLYWLQQGRSKRTVLHIDTHDDSRLLNEGSLDHLRSLAVAKDFTALKDKSGVAFSSGGKLFNIGNFLHAGFLLGVVKEVIWVLPASPRNLSDIQRVRGWLQQIGFDPASAQSFHMDNGVIRGNRAGMPMVICTSMQIQQTTEPVLVSLDIDYLMGKHKNPISSPMLQATIDLFQHLAAAKIATDNILVSYSVHGGSIPVMHKYTGDYLAKLLKQPAMLETALPQMWLDRDELLKTRARGETEAALQLAAKLLILEPYNASLHMEQAFALLQASRLEDSLAAMASAVALDPSYFLAYLEMALVVGQSDHYVGPARDAAIDQIFTAAGQIFALAAGDVDRVQACADFYRQGEYRRAQIELFRLVEDSVSPAQLQVFQPGQ
jgi:hypothetical protein